MRAVPLPTELLELLSARSGIRNEPERLGLLPTSVSLVSSHGFPCPQRMTLAEFLEWDDGTDRRYELLDGMPVMMAPSLRRTASWRLRSRSRSAAG